MNEAVLTADDLIGAAFSTAGEMLFTEKAVSEFDASRRTFKLTLNNKSCKVQITDDGLLFFLGDETWKLSGDPTTGGTLNKIT